jgi:hypothetical protein
MKQPQLDKLLAAPYAEFDRRLRIARFHAAGIDGLEAAPARSEAVAEDLPAERPLRIIEELVA